MLRALLFLAGLALVVGWSGRLAARTWRGRREAPVVLTLYRLALAYIISGSGLLLIATLLAWDPLLAAAALYAWPLVQVGGAYAEAVRGALPQSLVALVLIASAVLAALTLFLVDRGLARFRRP